jgi:hypothetical protein
MILDFAKIYKEAKIALRNANYHLKHDNSPILATEKLDETTQFSEPTEEDKYWYTEGLSKGNRLNKALDEKYQKIYNEIQERRKLGVEINWSSENKKNNYLSLINDSNEFIANTKDLRKISIEINKKLEKINNLLKSYKLI